MKNCARHRNYISFLLEKERRKCRKAERNIPRTLLISLFLLFGYTYIDVLFLDTYRPAFEYLTFDIFHKFKLASNYTSIYFFKHMPDVNSMQNSISFYPFKY